MDIEIYVGIDRKYKKNGKVILEKGGQMNILYVKRDGKYYNPYIMEFDYFIARTNERFSKGFINNNEARQFIVKDMTKECVIQTLLKAEKNLYFDLLKECEVINGEIMYDLREDVKKLYLEQGDPISCPIKKLKMIYPLDETEKKKV